MNGEHGRPSMPMAAGESFSGALHAGCTGGATRPSRSSRAYLSSQTFSRCSSKVWCMNSPFT